MSTRLPEALSNDGADVLVGSRSESALGPGPPRISAVQNAKVLSFIRDDWIAKQLRSRESEYTDFSPVDVFVGTWNVNGKKVTEEIATWLFAGQTE